MSKYGIVGDNFGTDLPQTEVDHTELTQEMRAAKYSKSAEFQKLREHLESRIDFYQKFLPDGRPITDVTTEERAHMWVAANAIIAEITAVMNYYDSAREVVEDARRENT